MELYKHDINLFSIKEIGVDFDISLKKWDFIFNFLRERTTAVYFLGNRLEYSNKELQSTIDFIVDNNQRLQCDANNLAIKVKISSIDLNRGLINKLWHYYEYPSLVFSKKELVKEDFLRLSRAKYYEEILYFLEGIYIIYKSFESNVLWVQNSIDMDSYAQ